MKELLKNKCSCHSNKNYLDCCKTFHDGEFEANALLLMRSRYSAYAIDIPDYIIKTTHPNCPEYQKNKDKWRENISQFSQSSFFNNLKIPDFKEYKNGSTVTFTEKSYFEVVDGRWLYLKGEISKKKS
jgi:SEC-C motif-containing protein